MRRIALLCLLATSGIDRPVVADEFVLCVEHVVPAVWTRKPEAAPAAQTLEFAVEPGVPFGCEWIVGDETLACDGILQSRDAGGFQLRARVRYAKAARSKESRPETGAAMPAEEWSAHTDRAFDVGEQIVVTPQNATRWQERARKAVAIFGRNDLMRIALRAKDENAPGRVQMASGNLAVGDKPEYAVRVSNIVLTDITVGDRPQPQEEQRLTMVLHASEGKTLSARGLCGTTEFILNNRLRRTNEPGLFDIDLNAKLLQPLDGQPRGRLADETAVDTSTTARLRERIALGGQVSEKSSTVKGQKRTTRSTASFEVLVESLQRADSQPAP